MMAKKMDVMKTPLFLLISYTILCGCAGSPPEQKNRSTSSDIEALIEKLAISEQLAGDFPVYTPSRNTPKTDKRIVAYDAADKIKSYGKLAFPYLLKHLGDKRQSVAFRRVIPHDVADACYCIIRSQVFLLPESYHGSFYRKGADGENHGRPYFLKPALFTPQTIESWLAERRDMTLSEMQIEALQWLIEKEKEIGFQNKEDKKKFLYPLERQLKKVERRLNKDTKEEIKNRHSEQQPTNV